MVKKVQFQPQLIYSKKYKVKVTFHLSVKSTKEFFTKIF